MPATTPTEYLTLSLDQPQRQRTGKGIVPVGTPGVGGTDLVLDDRMQDHRVSLWKYRDGSSRK